MKPHITYRDGKWCLWRDRNDASFWPFPVVQARSLRELATFGSRLHGTTYLVTGEKKDYAVMINGKVAHVLKDVKPGDSYSVVDV